VEHLVVPLPRVYELIGVDQMKRDEQSYMPAESPGLGAIVLCAGQSHGLQPLTTTLPKAMLDIKGKSILERQVEVLNDCGIKNIAVVRGYRKEAIGLPNLRYYDNDEYESTNELYSLLCADKEMSTPFVFLYGDILFESGHLQKLLKSPAEITILVDRAWNDAARPGDAPRGGVPDLVVLEDAQEAGYRFIGADSPHRVRKVGRNIDSKAAQGEFVGMALFGAEGARLVREIGGELRAGPDDRRFHEAASLRTATFTDLLQELIDRGHPVQALDVFKGWIEVDTFEDYKRAWALIKQ
jgi:phosphoenolpyruvate phosphomutase